MKSGIDYFPLDVNLDSKFELIEAEFGLTGFGVVVKLFQRIYGGHGYYLEWTNEVALLFARRNGLGGGAVFEIINASIRRGIFDREKFEKHRILTSAGIQRRYFEAVSRRKALCVKAEYLLVDCARICTGADISSVNASIVCRNANIPAQSKVEKRKEKDRKGEDTPAPTHGQCARGQYQHVLLTDAQFECLCADFGEARVWEYIRRVDEYVQMHGKPYRDYNLVLRRWIGTDKQADASYDIDEFERLALRYTPTPPSEDRI